MTAADIAGQLMLSRWRRNFVLPNFHAPGWWECDVFELTEAGYFREYEIKLSVADFRADAAKCKTVYGKWNPDLQSQNSSRRVGKHDLLAEGSVRGPSRFWYVTPKGLIAPDRLPSFAGLIEFEKVGFSNYPRETEVVKAPALHREKAPADLCSAARRNAYFRYHDARYALACRKGGGGINGFDPEASEWVI